MPLNFKCLPFSHLGSNFHNFWNVSCEYIELRSKYIKFRFLGVYSLIFLCKISSLNKFLDHFQTSITQKSLNVRTWNFEEWQTHALTLTYQKITLRFSPVFEIFVFLWTLYFEYKNSIKISKCLKVCNPITKIAKKNLEHNF